MATEIRCIHDPADCIRVDIQQKAHETGPVRCLIEVEEDEHYASVLLDKRSVRLLIEGLKEVEQQQ